MGGPKQKQQSRAAKSSRRRWFHEAYFSYMPRRRGHRWLVIAAILVLAGVIGFQLVYPTDRALPLASINGLAEGYKSHDELAKTITDQFAASKMTLKVGNDKKVTADLGDAGAVPNTEDMISMLADYPLWQRLIPGSILWQPVQLKEVSAYFDKVPLTTFAQAQAKALSFAPQNARLAIAEGKLTATAEIAGSNVDATTLAHFLSSATFTLGQTTTLEVPSKRTAPDRTLDDLTKVRAEAEAAISHTVTLAVGGKTFTPSRAEVASWILLNTDSAGNVALSLDEAKVTAYISELNKQVGTPAGQTNIDLVNGQETGRTTGAVGKAIDPKPILAQLKTALFGQPGPIAITGTLADVQPSVIYNHKYTTTQEGLQAYVSDTAASQHMNIVVQQMTGAKWYAAADENESIPSGSTYKLFVAKILFDKIDKGEIHWDDPMLDTTVDGCFDRMTVASTNPCAEAWIAQFGRQYINNYIYGLGFSTGTTFLAPDATHTTAADLTKYMIELYNGTILSGANKDKLLYNLSRHPYKYGIATGSVVPANQVYDKVGFLWDYIHDTGIVMHPKGPYILTIMTKGQSYAAIANVTREIERIMYP